MKKMAKKKRRDVKSLITPKLRQMSRYWHEKRTARDAAKVKVEIGTFKNGNIKHHTMYRCNSCGKTLEYTESKMDHIKSVVPVNIEEILEEHFDRINDDEFLGILNCDQEMAFQFFEMFIIMSRLFTKADNYQCLCDPCHDKKSAKENAERRKFKL